MSMQYTAIFHSCKNVNFYMIFFFLFCSKHRFWVHVTHNLCFGAKIRKKKLYPCKPQFYCIKVGCKGVFVTRTCFRDACAFRPKISHPFTQRFIVSMFAAYAMVRCCPPIHPCVHVSLAYFLLVIKSEFTCKKQESYHTMKILLMFISKSESFSMNPFLRDPCGRAT